jgi:RNA ligase
VIGQFDRERLDSMVAEGWLRSQRHPEADLWIYNYTEKTQFENHWTPETLACRGLILGPDGGIVARPFPKFFNYGDPQVGPIPKGGYRITEKIDGSLGIMYRLGGEARLATRGSFTSEQALEGTAMLADYDYFAYAGSTPLFEIVYPQNRIVVDYGNRRELVLLAVLDNATGMEAEMQWRGPTVDRHDYLEIADLPKQSRANHEGYVVTFPTGLRFKVKHAEYVRLHRIITGVNARTIWDALRSGDEVDALLDGVPDEIHDWISAVRRELNARFFDEDSHCRAVFGDRPVDADRKALATYFQSSEANPAVLFRMLDGKPYDDLIWKAIKPEPTTPDTVWTRDEVAA